MLSSHNENELLQKQILELQNQLKNAKQDVHNEDLLSACRTGQKENMLSALNLKGSVEATDQEGNTPLFLCFQNKHFDCAEYLMSHTGANLSYVNKNEETILQVMAQKGDIKAVKLILNYLDKSDPKATLLLDVYDFLKQQNSFENDQTIKQMIIDMVLLQAAKQNNIELAELALNKGANINTQTKRFGSPLHLACSYEYVDMVKFLLSKNCNINLVNCNNEKPIEQTQNQDIINLLNGHIEKKATKITATVKTFLARRKYAHELEKEEQRLNYKSTDILLDLHKNRKYAESMQLSSAFFNHNLHTVRRIINKRPEKEFALESSVKIRY